MAIALGGVIERSKEWYAPPNAATIAAIMGYVFNRRFEEAVTRFWNETISGALPSCEQNITLVYPRMLETVNPPLDRLSPKN